MNETQLELLKYAVTNHLNNLSLEEVQKIFNQNLDYSEIAHEYVILQVSTKKVIIQIMTMET